MAAYRQFSLHLSLSMASLLVVLSVDLPRTACAQATLTTTPPTTTPTTMTTTPTTMTTTIVPVPVATGNIVNIVGGVMVYVDGGLNRQDDRQRAEVLAVRRKGLQKVPVYLNQPTKLRVISLKGLEEVIAACVKAGKPLPDEAKYLAGLTRVRYVFVYPEQNDIVLAGPAEGWKVNDQGDVVASTS